MPTVLDDKIKATIAEHGWVKTLLGVLLAGLTFGKGRGWFSKSDAPR